MFDTHVRRGTSRTAAFLLVLMMLAAGAAPGQSLPARHIRIVTSQVGGLNDLISRVIAPPLSSSLGRPVIVENRGTIAIDIVAHASPDGHTLLCFANNFWLLPFMQDKATFGPVRDFSPLTLAVTAPNVLAVHSSVPASTVRELIAIARSRPGTLNYGAGATGGTPHLAAELFKTMAGINIVHIGYKGTGPAIIALVGGETHMMFAGPGSVDPHVKSGRLKALAVTSRAPSVLTPGLPTLWESGLPGYEATAMIALLVPAGTPATIVTRLNQEIVKALNLPDVKQKLLAAGTEVAGSSPGELTRLMKSEMSRWEKII
ncbi:MAG TPA: tripartite tricarboxylate transporter substrate binding protein [Burkholderiales bacterium]|nr:tripartite tricarboxylate transporter substrate binding protein [Burkholderiales bacterium]